MKQTYGWLTLVQYKECKQDNKDGSTIIPTNNSTGIEWKNMSLILFKWYSWWTS